MISGVHPAELAYFVNPFCQTAFARLEVDQSYAFEPKLIRDSYRHM
jgi:hypothetical protein